MKRVILILSFFIPAILFSEEYRFVMNTGFTSSVEKIFFDEDTQYLVNISEDGQILILDPVTQRAVKKYNLSNKKIIDVIINPEFSEIAILTYEDLEFGLEMWDWHRGVKLHEEVLNDKPLFLRYTMTGKKLVVGQSELPSIVFLDHNTGRDLNLMEDATQLLQDAYIGSSEKILMGYSLSGNLYYYQIQTGNLLGTVDAISGLSQINVLQTGDKTIALVENLDTYFLINRQTGEILDQLAKDDQGAVSIDTQKGLLTFTKRIRGNDFLYQYDLSTGMFSPTYNGLLIGQGTTTYTSFVAIGSICYLGTSEGDFFLYYMDTQEMIPFFEETVLEIQNIAVMENLLYIASKDRAIQLDSPFLKNNSHWDELQKIRQTNQVYPNSGRYRFDVKDNNLYAYSIAETNPSALLQRDNEGLLERNPTMGENLFHATNIDSLGNLFMFLNNQSHLSIMDRDTGAELFQWDSPSQKQSVFIDPEHILIGKALSPDASGSALEYMNIYTGEISPLESEFFYILDMKRDTASERIYVLGLKETRGTISTSLSYYSLEDLSLSRELFSIEREDYSSKIFLDSRNIYVTLSGLGFVYFDGRRTRTIGTNRDVLDMDFSQDKMILLYDNRSLGFWDSNTLKEKYQMFFFSDYSWLLVSSDYTNYYYTPDAKDNFFVYKVIRR